MIRVVIVIFDLFDTGDVAKAENRLSLLRSDGYTIVNSTATDAKVIIILEGDMSIPLPEK